MLDLKEVATNPLFLIPALVAPVMFVAGLMMLIYPPKKINSLYGYRTPASMQSQERWNFAQYYSSKKIIWWSIILLLTALLGFFYKFHNFTGVIIGLLLMIFCLAMPIFQTEKKLKLDFKI